MSYICITKKCQKYMNTQHIQLNVPLSFTQVVNLVGQLSFLG